MPDVGVLNLEIRDNSSEAGKGLSALAGALSRVKTAIGEGEGIGLSKIGTDIAAFTTAIKDSVPAIKILNDFGNSMAKLSKVTSFSLKAKDFEGLQEAVSGFNIGNVGSQLNQLRLAVSGKWGDGSSLTNLQTLHDTIQSMESDAPILNNFAEALKNSAEAMEQMNTAASAAGDWRMGMMGASTSTFTSTGADVAAGLQTGMESGREGLISVATELAEAIIEAIRSNLEINSPSKITTEFGEYTGEGLAVGLQNSMPEVVRAAGDITDSVIERMEEITEREKYIGLDLNQFLPDTVSSLPGIFRDMSDTVSLLGDAVGVSLPNMQQMSSEEMVIAGNAREATAAVDELMKRLNSGKNWNGGKLDGFKNLSEFINFSQGIGRQFTSKSSEADLLLQNADRLNGTYTETEQVVSQVKSRIDEAVESMRQGNVESSEWYQNAVKINQEMAAKYAPNRDQTFEEWYNGYRPGIGRGKRDLMSEWLHGEGTKNEQQYALETTARKFGMTVDEVKTKIAELQDQYAQFNKMNGAGQEAQNATQKFFENLGVPQTSASDMVKSLVGDVSQVDLMQAKLESLQQSLTEDIQNNKLSTQQIADRAIAIQNLQDKIQNLKDAQDTANESTRESTITWKKLKAGISAMFPTLSGLIKRFKSIATMRALRYVIRQISAGISEGVQNVYYYSKAVGTSFAPIMDSAATSLLTFKNSIGAAVSPLLSALVPALQTVVNWLIQGINYINQFFALLNGQASWTKAINKTTTAYNDQTKAAKGAGAAVKDLLADWDELNIIQSNAGGGGGGGGSSAAEDYLNMFEEVGIFDNKIKDIVNFIKDNFETIKTIAAAIGAALLAWKIANGVESVLDKITMLKGGIIMSVIGFALSAAAGASIADNGFTVENVLMTIGGLAASGFGGYWVGKAALSSLGLGAAGGAIGAIAGVAIGLAFLINSYQVRSAENAYGDIEEDAETIRKNVLSYFNPKATAEIDIIKARIKDEEDAKQKVGEALSVLERDYPIAISLKTDEELKNLTTDVSNLVAETNALILLRKQNIRIPIMLSGQYDNPDSLVEFTDKQWDKTSEYVTNLGKKIGELISKGITDGAELDGLQQRLNNIVRAITYGQTSGEFAGKMSLAAANLRNNGYTKKTVEGYIDTYKQERQNLVDQANAAAVSEKADLKALYAAVEERYKNHDATYQELRLAADAYNKFDIAKEAERYIKEWVGEGDQLFFSDVAEGLSKVMQNNTNNAARWQVGNMASNFKALRTSVYNPNGDFTAEDYINSLKSGILSTISQETGMEMDVLQELFDTSGIDPLDLFGADFAEQVRSGVVATIEGSSFTEEEKNRIAQAFGLEGKKINAPEVDHSMFDSSLNAMTGAALDAVTYIKSIIESLNNFSVEVSVNESSYTPPRTGGGGGAQWRMATRAGGGYVRSGDLVMANENGNFELMGKMGNQPVVANNQQIISGISQGVATANGDVVSELRTLASLMQKMLNKEFVAKAVPSADWGNHNSRSNEAWSRVNG